MTDEIDYWRQCAADANAQLNAMRKRAEKTETELMVLRGQTPVECVAVSVAVDAAHIAARGNYQAAIHHLHRYAHPSYGRPIPAEQPGQPATLPIEIAGNLLPDDYVSPRLAAEAYRENGQ